MIDESKKSTSNNDENIAEIIQNSISYMGKRFSKNIKFEKNISVKSKKIKHGTIKTIPINLPHNL